MHTSKSSYIVFHICHFHRISSPVPNGNSIALVFATCDLRPEKEGDDAGCFPISYCLSEGSEGERGSVALRVRLPCRRGRRDGMTESWRPLSLSSPPSRSLLPFVAKTARCDNSSRHLESKHKWTTREGGRQSAEKQPSLVPHICLGVGVLGVRAKSES